MSNEERKVDAMAKVIGSLIGAIPPDRISLAEFSAAIWQACEQAHMIGVIEIAAPPPPPVPDEGDEGDEVVHVAISKPQPKLGSKSAKKRIVLDRVLITGSRGFVRCSIGEAKYVVEFRLTLPRSGVPYWKKHAVKVERRRKSDGQLYLTAPHGGDERRIRVLRYAAAAITAEDQVRKQNGKNET